MPELKKRINKNGTVVYGIRIFTGFDPETGKKRMINRTVNTSSKKEALKIADEILAQRDKGTLVVEKESVGSLLDSVLLDYKINGKRFDWLEHVLKHVRPHFGGMRPEQVTTTELQRYIAKRQSEGAANATINHGLAILRRAFNLGAKATPRRLAAFRTSRC